MAEERADILALAGRVEALALAVGGRRDAENIAKLEHGTVVDVVREVRAKLSGFQSQELVDFETKYQKIAPLLEANSLSLPMAAKTEVVLAAESFLLDAVTLLNKVAELSDVADHDCVPGLDGKRQQVKPLQKVHLQQQIGALHTQQRLDDLVDSYNTNLRGLQAQLMAWDAQLTEWESKVGK